MAQPRIPDAFWRLGMFAHEAAYTNAIQEQLDQETANVGSLEERLVRQEEEFKEQMKQKDEAARISNDEQQAKIKSLKDQVKRLRGVNKTQDDQLGDLRDKSEKRIADLKRKMAKLEDENKKQSEKLESIRKEAGALKTKVSDLEGNNRRQKAELTRIGAHNRKLTEELERTDREKTEELERIKNENNELAAANQKRQKEIDDLRRDLFSKNRELRDLQDKENSRCPLKDKENKTILKILKQRNLQTEDSVRTHLMGMDTLNKKVDGLKTQLAAKEKKLLEMEATNNAQLIKINALEAENASLKSANEKEQEKSGGLAEENGDLKGKLVDLENKLSESKTKFNTKTQEADFLHKKSNKALADSERAAKLAKELAKKNVEANRIAQENSDKFRNLQEKTSEILGENAALNATKKNLERQIAEKDARIEKLDGDLKESASKVGELTSRILELEEVLATKRAEIQRKNPLMRQMMELINGLDGDLKKLKREARSNAEPPAKIPKTENDAAGPSNAPQ